MCADYLVELIYFSTLKSADSLEQFLVDEGFATRSWIKKYLSKKQRMQVVYSGMELAIPSAIINSQIIAPCPNKELIDVVEETADILALRKPPGVHCYPLNYQDRESVVNWVRNYNHELLNVNQQHMDRGLLYRLDYETSGILLYAKNDAVYDHFRNSFNARSEKRYLAVVHGEIGEHGELVHWLKGAGVKGEHVKVFDEPVDGASQAELSFSRWAYEDERDLSLVEVTLKTGLRHQIRVQLAMMGFPIVGDTKYGGAQDSRLYLHALSYELEGMEPFVVLPEAEGLLFHDLLGLNC